MCHTEFLQKVSRTVFREGDNCDSVWHPSTPISHGKATPYQYLERDLVHKGHSNNGGGRKATARKGTEPKLINLSLNLFVPGPVSLWW